jgi:hypothetical protein
MLTYVAPDGRKVQRIVVPHNGVHELVQTRQGHPENVETSAGVPCLEVPRQRDKRQEEAEECEDGKQRVRVV